MIFVGTDAESVMTRTLNLTPSTVDRLSRGSLRDPATPGLSIEVLSSGRKVWRYARRIAGDGTIVRMSLGREPAETVVLNLETGRYHGLNPTGGRMLEVVEQAATLRQAAEQLAREYDRPLAEIEQDLCAFCSDLAARDLIVLDPASG